MELEPIKLNFDWTAQHANCKDGIAHAGKLRQGANYHTAVGISYSDPATPRNMTGLPLRCNIVLRGGATLTLTSASGAIVGTATGFELNIPAVATAALPLKSSNFAIAEEEFIHQIYVCDASGNTIEHLAEGTGYMVLALGT